MARIRTVKPEFWTDEAVGEVSPNARLLFIGSWNFSDDHGGLDRSAKQLKAQVFPYDQIDCEPLVQELLRVGLLIEYEVDGKTYLHIKGFREHQKVEKPGKPRIPLYEPSVNVHRGVTYYSEKSACGLESSLEEGKGVESKQSREERACETGEVGNKLIPSKAAMVCKAIKDAGILDVNSAHPKLIALVGEGAELEEFVEAGKEAIAKQVAKPFPYLLAVIEGRRREAARMGATGLSGALPAMGRPTATEELLANLTPRVIEHGT